MSRKWLYWRLGQILIDLSFVWGTFLLAYFIRVEWIFSSDFWFWPYFWTTLVASGLWIGFLLIAKYYRLPPRSGWRSSFDWALVLAGGVAAVSSVVVLYFFNQELFFSRLISLYSLLLGSSFLLVSRTLFNLALSRAKKQNQGNYRTLIIGANRVSSQLIKAIEAHPYAPYHIVGVVDPYGINQGFDAAKILGKLDRLEDICHKQKITAIIQCDGFEHTINFISLCEQKNIKFQFDPALRGIYEKNLRLREIAGQTMISYVQRDFVSSWRRNWFRVVDLILRQVFGID